MADIDDFSSPHDASDEARATEPPDGYNERKPVDLDDLQKLYDLARGPGALPSWSQVVFLEVPNLIAELNEARRRIAEFEALPTREEWTVTESASRPPRSTDRSVWGGTAEMVADYAAKHGVQMWRRVVSEHPAEPIELDAPF